MAKAIPFTIAIKETITASGTVEFTYRAPQNQPVEVVGAIFLPAAACSLIRMQVNGSQILGTMSTADPIPSTELPKTDTDVRALNLFRVPLRLEGGDTLIIELLDTSAGSNLVTVLLEAIMYIP